MTARWIPYVLTVAGAYLASSYWGFLIFKILLIILLLLPIAGLLQLLLVRRQLRVQWQAQATDVTRGETASWLLTLQNLSDWLTTHCRLTVWYGLGDAESTVLARKTAFFVREKTTTRMLVQLDTPHCGPIAPSEVRLRQVDCFGLFQITLKSALFDSERHVINVLPHALVPDFFSEQTLKQLEAGEINKAKSDEQSDDIDQMRQMQPGDPLKRVHWKISARLQEWMVKVYENPEELQFTVLLDYQIDTRLFQRNRDAMLERQMNLRDFILEMATGLIESMLRQEVMVHLCTYRPEPFTYADHKVTGLDAFRRQLALLPREGILPLGEQLRMEGLTMRTCPYIILVSRLDETTLVRLRTFGRQANGILLMWVHLRDDADDFDLNPHIESLRAERIFVNEIVPVLQTRSTHGEQTGGRR